MKYNLKDKYSSKALGENKPVPKEKWWQRISGYIFPKNKGFEFKVNIRF